MENKSEWKRRLRAIVSLVLVGLYILGLIAMIAFSFQTGLILWVVSTLGGIGLLYWIRTTEKQPEDAGEAKPEEGGAEADAGEGASDEGE